MKKLSNKIVIGIAWLCIIVMTAIFIVATIEARKFRIQAESIIDQQLEIAKIIESCVAQGEEPITCMIVYGVKQCEVYSIEQ